MNLFASRVYCQKKRTKLLEKHVNQQIFLARNKNHIPSRTTVFCNRPVNPRGSDYDSEPEVVVDDDETQSLDLSLQD